jgi:hypothetical protein
MISNNYSDASLSTHANKRMQQRGIKEQILDTLLAYGDYQHKCGADIYHASISACKEMIAEGVNPQVMDKLNGLYAVVVNDTIVTVSHKH